MPYRDSDKQREAQREAVRRYRERRKGITPGNTEGVIPSQGITSCNTQRPSNTQGITSDVIPGVIPCNTQGVIPSQADHERQTGEGAPNYDGQTGEGVTPSVRNGTWRGMGWCVSCGRRVARTDNYCRDCYDCETHPYDGPPGQPVPVPSIVYPDPVQHLREYIQRPTTGQMSNLERLQRIAGSLGANAEDVLFGGLSLAQIGKAIGTKPPLRPK